MQMNNNKFDVVIIGGGYSGIISAIQLKKNGLDVCIVEAQDRIGKKILSTGNGRFNFSNTTMSSENYNTAFVSDIIKDSTLSRDYLKSLGIISIVEEGRCYPQMESAASVLNVFLDQLNYLKINVLLNSEVTKIEKKDLYIVNIGKKQLFGKYVILATGSNATFGKNSHGLLEPFGHKTTRLVQTLVSLKQSQIKGANGVRCHVEARLYINKKFIKKEFGEILFKDGFISGILIFRLSSFISRYLVKEENAKSVIVLDFVPSMTEKELRDFIKNTKNKNVLQGIVHKALIPLFDKEKDVAYSLKNFAINIEGLANFKNAQVTSGGLDTQAFNSKTLESKLSKNLYALGEVLDVDGECGGYNLHFALASALQATQDIISKEKV